MKTIANQSVFIVKDGEIMTESTNKTTYWVLFSTALITFLGILNETSMNVTYQILCNEFHISLDMVQWITAGYLLIVTIIMGTTDYLIRKYAVRWLHLTAGVSFIFGCLMCALAPNFTVLLIGRLIQGIATGFSTPLMFHLIFTQIPKSKIGVMSGVAGMVISFAPALGPTFGGAVASIIGWRWVFWIIIPFVILGTVVGQFTIHKHYMVNDKPFSFFGLLFLGISLFCFVFATSQLGSHGFTQDFWMWVLLGILLTVIFVTVNHFGKAELINLQIFKYGSISLATVTYFCLQFINIGLSVIIPTYAIYVLHSSSFIAGLILLPGSIAGAFTSPLAGTIADRIGFRLPISIGSYLMIIGTWFYIGPQVLLTPLFISLVYIVIRVGFNLAFYNTISNASTVVNQKETADVNSVFNMVQQFAGSISVSLSAALISIQQRNKPTSAITFHTYLGGRQDFIMMFLLAVVIAITVWLNFHLQAKQAQN